MTKALHSTPPLELTDGVVTLRAMEPTDIDTITGWENDSRMWCVSSTAAPFSRRVIEDYVMNYDADIFSARQLRLMVVSAADGTPLGAVDLYDFDPVNRRAGVGIVTDEAWRRRGVGARALALLAGYCRRRLGIHQLWAIAAADNEASSALFARAGYATSGRLRSWIRDGESYTDAYFLQKLL